MGHETIGGICISTSPAGEPARGRLVAQPASGEIGIDYAAASAMSAAPTDEVTIRSNT
jgi:hypothetical protein